MSSKFLNYFSSPMESSYMVIIRILLEEMNECGLLNNEMLKVTAHNVPVSLILASRTSRHFWFL